MTDEPSMTPASFPVAHPFDVSRLGNRTERVTLRPDADAIARMIAAYDLADLRDLACTFEIRPYRKDGVAVQGRLTATAIQPCVVTLEPVAQTIDERFERRFDPGAESTAEDAEIEVDALGDDPADPLEGRDIDLGAILCEQFALALDPFPRAPGAEVPPEHRADPEADADAEAGARTGDRSPFAVLAELRKREDGA